MQLQGEDIYIISTSWSSWPRMYMYVKLWGMGYRQVNRQIQYAVIMSMVGKAVSKVQAPRKGT